MNYHKDYEIWTKKTATILFIIPTSIIKVV